SFGGLATFVPAAAPLVTTTAAGNLASTTATLNASINPDGNSTTAWFRFSTANPGACSNSFGTQSGTSFIGAGAAAVSVPINVGGLTPGATYYYCAIAQNSYGTSMGAVLSFTAAAAAPSAFTGGATSVTSTSAVLNGQGIAGGA